MIKENLNNLELNKPEHFESLSDEEKRELLRFIKDRFSSRTKFNTKHTSYGLKHYFEHSRHGFYITNGQFKGAMLESGYRTKNKNELNWIFNANFIKLPTARC